MELEDLDQISFGAAFLMELMYVVFYFQILILPVPNSVGFDISLYFL